MTTDQTGAGLRILQTSSLAGIGFDVALGLFLFALQVLLLVFLLKVVTRREADVSSKKCVFMVLFLDLVFFFTNTTPEARFAVRAFLVTSLLGSLVCAKLFWLSIENGVKSCFLFCLLSLSQGAGDAGHRRARPWDRRLKGTGSA